MENQFEVGGRKFQLNKINAFKQFHLVRRIAPILSEMLPAFGEAQKITSVSSQLSEKEQYDQLAKIAGPLLVGFSKLSDSDSDKVLYVLLSSVQVQQSVGWAWVATDTTLMIQDLELPEMLQVAGRAFMYNLSGFFRVLPQVS